MRLKKMFQGKHTHRFKDNPMEKKLASAWAKENSSRRPLLGGLLESYPEELPLERDWLVANTVIQWLGSPVGRDFLKGTLGPELATMHEEWVREEESRKAMQAHITALQEARG